MYLYAAFRGENLWLSIVSHRVHDPQVIKNGNYNRMTQKNRNWEGVRERYEKSKGNNSISESKYGRPSQWANDQQQYQMQQKGLDRQGRKGFGWQQGKGVPCQPQMPGGLPSSGSVPRPVSRSVGIWGSPGRKDSSITSARAHSDRNTAAPRGCFRSTASERLPLPIRLRSPRVPGRSTRTTCAPKSARTIPQNGPGARPASSTTETPCKAMGTRISFRRRKKRNGPNVGHSGLGPPLCRTLPPSLGAPPSWPLPCAPACGRGVCALGVSWPRLPGSGAVSGPAESSLFVTAES